MKTDEIIKNYFSPIDLLEIDIEDMKKCLIEFAQYHVNLALDSAAANAELDLISNYRRCEISDTSILNSYPLSNIE